MTEQRERLEQQLNHLEPAIRRAALAGLLDMVDMGEIDWPEPGDAVNLHCHSFFSFNGYGYSPSCLAWKARCAGLAAAGVVDFDVLDAVDEFLEACRLVGLRGCAGLETRVYLPEFASREINSPGEPGIAYHMGAGFVSTDCADPAMLTRLKDIARARNEGMLDRVNACLDPLLLDYERDVLPLTPEGNATERHMAVAYDMKAQEEFPDENERAAFWAEKLGVEENAVRTAAEDPPVFQGLIRSKLMKAGGVGYVKPEGPDFPRLDEVNRFILDAGAIPVVTWLDGLSEGEQAIGELLDVMAQSGAAALNIIPDRNWNIGDPEKKATKVAKLHEIVDTASKRGMPLLVGTEMNAYGQRFIDDFEAPEMAPLVKPALEGAQILFAHTLLQARQGMGYLSAWAKAQFDSVGVKNAFYAELGRILDPEDPTAVDAVGPEMSAEEVRAELMV